jgi:TonB family protein
MAIRSDHVLRLRVYQDATVREHLIPPGKCFTYGRDAGNDLVVLAASAPKSRNLVESDGRRYFLILPKEAKGEERVGDSALRIEDLIRHGLLHRSRDGYRLPIWNGKSGKLELDGFHVEFDFVAPPPELVALPDYSWRRRFLRAVVEDPALKLSFVVLLVVSLAWVKHVTGLQFPERPMVELEQVPQRFAKFIPRPMRREPEVRSELSGGTTSGTERSAGGERKSEAGSSTGSREGGASVVVQRGILGLIGGSGESGSSSSVIDFLVGQGLVKDMDQVLAESGELQVGRPEGRPAGSSSLDDLFSLDNLAKVDVDQAVGEAASSFGGVQLKKEGLVELDRAAEVSGSQEAIGQRGEEQLRSVILANRGRIEYVYNKYLRTNPTLAGKLLLEITIEPDGTVSDVRVLENTLGDIAFVNEILGIVRRWRFPPIAKGVVVVTYPMIFYRAG